VSRALSRILVPTSAFLWGLQFSFLGPVLSLLLVNLFGASTAEVGWVLGIYNAGGFVASLVVPAYADRKHDYLRPMLLAGLLTVALAAVLAFAANLSMVTVALVALGGPAGVGSSLLFAQLRHTGHAAAQIVNTRALISLAWVAGPPLATVIMSAPVSYTHLTLPTN
jgi:SET family sugar efflux transporter-like MFS transporter